MSIQWSGSGPDVLLRLDRDDPEQSLGAQLQGQLRTAIRDGRLGNGEHLPSTRRLAADLGVARGTVVDAYDQLAAEGYLESSAGSATRVACNECEPIDERPAETHRRPAIDFAYGAPDLGAFPARDWLWAVSQAVREAPTTVLSNSDRRGVAELRQTVASYTRRVRAAATSSDEVVICAGFAQGVALAAAVLADRGIRTAAIEDPGYQDSRSAFDRTGMSVVAVPVDEAGIDVDALAATAARVVVVSPAHQAPTGVVLAPERRHQLVAWARAVDGYVIEDDYDAEFRYDRAPVGAVQGLAPDRVIAVGSVSKSLAPGVRLGWMLSPPALTPAITAEKARLDRGSSGIDQYALSELIRSGRYDRHLRRMRGRYAERRTALIGALAEHAPNATVNGLAAGFHAVVALPPGADEDAVVATAAERGVGVEGLRRWRADGVAAPPSLLLGFGALTPSSIRRGIADIGDLLRPPG